VKRPISFTALFLTAASLAISLASSVSAAPDWTEFRGNGKMGHSDASGIPLEWSKRQNVAWKSEIEGSGWSSPVVADGKVFVTSAVERGGKLSLRAIALDASSGTAAWDVEIFTPKEVKMHKKNSQASPTPVFEGGKLYVHFGHYGTACLNAGDGKILWTQEELSYPPVHGNGGSPIIVGNKLVFSCDGSKSPFVVALDKDSGKVRWKTDRNVEVSRKFSFTTPLAIEVGGKTQIISPGSGAVIAYDPDTGDEIWRVDYDEGYSVVPRPVYSEDLKMVYVCTGFGKANLLGIRVDPAARGDVTETHLVWQQSKGIPKESSPLLVDGLIFLNDDRGVASCFDAKTGEVLWQERIATGGYSTSPVYAAGHIFFQNDEGKTTVVKPGRELNVVGENDLDEKAQASWAIVDGAIFIRTEEHLWRISG
jgi:outer membrane protein assembly factor BamB